MYCTDTDTDSAAQAAVKDGQTCCTTRPTGNYLHLRSWLFKYGSDNEWLEHGVSRLPTGTKPKVLTMTQPLLKIFTRMMANWWKGHDDSNLGWIIKVDYNWCKHSVSTTVWQYMINCLEKLKSNGSDGSIWVHMKFFIHPLEIVI